MNGNNKAPKHAVERFRNNRFGMFIHYGLYSLLNRREWAMYYERIPVNEYRKLAARFKPDRRKIEDWVLLAKQAGMKYMCLTTRHHDGFCLFDTAETDFNSVRTAAGRDLVKEFVVACRKHELRPALYYSVANWSDPGFTDGPEKNPEGWKRFLQIAYAQLKELMTNYGPIDYLFYDGCPSPEDWQGAELNRELRQLQPELLISDRCQLDEDVASSENHLGAHKKPWECCMTTNESWGCNYGDIHRKSAFELIKSLATCMHNGGNFLLNMGPLADGSIHPEDRRLFGEIGAWVKRNAEAVYGTTACPFNYCDYKLSCARGNTAYIAFHFYCGPETVVAGIGNQVKNIRLLATGEEIAFNQDGNRIFMTGLPKKWPDIMPVVALELDGPPQGVLNPYQCGKTKFVF
jgi:alpha-L-fucosidase